MIYRLRLCRQHLASLPTALADPVLLRLQSILDRKLTVIVDQLGPLRKNLDSEAPKLPGQKVNGNSGAAGAPAEKLGFRGFIASWAER